MNSGSPPPNVRRPSPSLSRRKDTDQTQNKQKSRSSRTAVDVPEISGSGISDRSLQRAAEASRNGVTPTTIKRVGSVGQVLSRCARRCYVRYRSCLRFSKSQEHATEGFRLWPATMGPTVRLGAAVILNRHRRRGEDRDTIRVPPQAQSEKKTVTCITKIVGPFAARVVVLGG